MRILRLKLALFFCLFFAMSSYSQDLFDYWHSIQFADYLYQSQQFEKASAELERLQFLFPENDTLCLKISKSYFGNKEYKKAYSVIDNRFLKKNEIPAFIEKQYFSSALFIGDKFPFDSLINARTLKSHEEKLAYQLSNALFKADENSYNSLLKTLPDTITITANSLLRDYYKTFGTQIHLPNKSPALAGTLSAIVPGAGRLYVGRYADALFSFIIIGTSSYQGYRGFHKSGIKSVYGWVFSAIGFGFYSGNIYGSVKAAKQYNKKQKQKVIDLAKKIYTDNL